MVRMRRCWGGRRVHSKDDADEKAVVVESIQVDARAKGRRAEGRRGLEGKGERRSMDVGPEVTESEGPRLGGRPAPRAQSVTAPVSLVVGLRHVTFSRLTPLPVLFVLTDAHLIFWLAWGRYLERSISEDLTQQRPRAQALLLAHFPSIDSPLFLQFGCAKSAAA